MTLQPQFAKMGHKTLRRARHGEESRPKWRGIGVVQKVLGLCAVPLGAETEELLQARKVGHERKRNMFNIIFKLEEGRVPDRKEKEWKAEAEKGRVTRKEEKILSSLLRGSTEDEPEEREGGRVQK